MKVAFVFLITSLVSVGWCADLKANRPQRYAAYKAHTILPESLRFLVKRDARKLFEGLQDGMVRPLNTIDDKRIMAETDKITNMINGRAPFEDVIYQMGFVSGLVAVYTNPSLEGDARVRKGFEHYLNQKLGRCLFVFDGFHEIMGDQDLLSQANWINKELDQAPVLRRQFGQLLEDRYQKVGNNWRYEFDERSAVFGVSSIYFSNMARLTAHLWYYAWASAHGDLTRTPYRGIRKQAERTR